MENKLAIIGIDSLDPFILLKYKKELPNFSNIIDNSPTFSSESVFPVDTIPAWASIYTGLNPTNHGLLYVYDIFDPNLSDLKKLDINSIEGNTFWDHASYENLKTTILFPTLMYPPWEVNGVMISKSPFETKLNNLKTERDVLTCPIEIKNKYKIPDKLEDLWGGFPGKNNLHQWAQLGKEILRKEEKISIELYNLNNWDLFFVYFSILDIIQHRLWRFFDLEDPTYPGSNSLENQIVDYYKLFDDIIGKFINIKPEVPLLIISDHGHKMRPINKVNINEYLRKNGFLTTKNENRMIINKIKDIALKIITKLNIEHQIIKIVTLNPKMTKMSKSAYSSVNDIENHRSIASLSSFAGIKSYSYGGIEINQEIISKKEYEKIRSEIIDKMQQLTDYKNDPVLKWIKKREEIHDGIYVQKIFPDIVFDLKDGYCVGWDLFTDLVGKSYDHNVASGGHAKDAVLLMKNIDENIVNRKISIIDIAPTILDYLNITSRGSQFDGKSIFQ